MARVCKKCTYKVSVWGHASVRLRCSRCGRTTADIKLTKDEQRIHRALLKAEVKDSMLLHKCWHSFTSRFWDDEARTFKYTGYDFMQRAERWAERWPDDVQLVDCDDGYHASSLLILIQHQSVHEYMGCTAVYIPQCTGELATQFFLYPGAQDALGIALKKVRGQSRKKRPLSAVRIGRESLRKEIEVRVHSLGIHWRSDHTDAGETDD